MTITYFMKSLKHLGLLLLFVLTIMGCKNGQDPERTATLEKAGKIHDEGLALGAEVKDMIVTIDEILADLGNYKEAVSYSERTKAIKADYKTWQETLVEVPGHAHHHHEGEHHHHDHSMDNAPAEDILKKQEDSRDFITDIHSRTSRVTKGLQNLVESF